jgi:hypothetical protein
MPDDLMTVKEARAVLGVGTRKIAALIASGELHTQPDPLDKRIKLIRRSEVHALMERSSKLEKAA